MGWMDKLFGLDEDHKPEEASDRRVDEDDFAVIGRYDPKTRSRGHSAPMTRREAARFAEAQRAEGTGERIIVQYGQRRRW